jgi:hypothetical protein
MAQSRRHDRDEAVSLATPVKLVSWSIPLDIQGAVQRAHYKYDSQ